MNPARLVGPKIRERRRQLGVTQAALSAELGISASYLNLIEGGKRNIGGSLLKRIADALDLAVDELDGAQERRLLAELAELGSEPLLDGLRLEAASAEDFAGRHPAWAHALALLHRAWVDRGRAVSALSDRLTQDPFLGDAVHNLLTRASSIRSSAEIVETVEDLAPEQRRRFASIIGEESRRLADVAQALAAFFHSDRTDPRSSTPVGEVEDFLAQGGYYFAALEDRPQPAVLEQLVQASPLLKSDAARRRAHAALREYVAAAALMPYDAFLAAARRLRYDAEALAREFQASYEQVCRRLLTLRRPGAEGVPFGLMCVDAAGFTSQRYPLPHLPLPRHGGACPLWAAYLALQSPGTVVRQVAVFPGGERFLFVARAIDNGGGAFPLPRRLASLMLACDALHADQTVYGDGLDLRSSAPAVPVGANCRVCTRAQCAYRQEDPVIDA
jgi:transcriptional regulator with XRE-family HTH domain